MVVNVAEAVEFVKDIAQNEQVKTTIKGSLKGGLIVGCAAAAGGLCLGPVGFAIGGAVGGIGAAIAAKDTFKPLPDVVANMSPQDKQRLAHRVERFVQDFDVTDVATLAMMVAGNNRLREQVVQELIHFLTHEMRHSSSMDAEYCHLLEVYEIIIFNKYFEHSTKQLYINVDIHLILNLYCNT